MAELVRTTDPVLVSAVEGLLEEAGIRCHVADRNISVLEGSINVFPLRVLVHDDDEVEARALLTDAGLEEWVRP